MTAAIAVPASPPAVAQTESAIPVAPSRAPAPARPNGVAAGGYRRPYLTPVPESAPPFDDEADEPGSRAVHGPRTAAAEPIGQGPLVRGIPAIRVAGRSPIVDRVGWSAQPPAPATPPGRPATRTANVPPWSSEADIGVVRTATADLPPVHRAASVLARAIIEVMAGHRPVAQLRVHCSPAIYAGIGSRHIAVGRSLPHLLTVRVCEPADGVAEVSAVFRRSERVRALAFRLQGVDGRWRITALQLG
jgi:hypothetical protein